MLLMVVPMCPLVRQPLVKTSSLYCNFKTTFSIRSATTSSAVG
jgi:hypothetical protein